MIEIGQKATIIKSFTSADVKLFAELSEDKNPIHLDDKVAELTIFKKPIVHGFLYSSLISAIIANELPGPGSVYITQELIFLKPVYHNQLIKAEVEVVQIKPERSIYVLATKCYDEEGEVVLDGSAVIKKIIL